MAIRRNFDIRNLVRELAENKVSALEVVREALSNARDHGAERVWIRTEKDQRNEVTITIADDGEGMDQERLEAFWGVGATSKADRKQAIGYKGHGTKLFFDCQRLSVATRTGPSAPWRITTLDAPLKRADDEVPEATLQPGSALEKTIAELGLDRGTVILIEDVGFEDRNDLTSRSKIESYCDWFTVVGDVRSGLFDARVEFHRAYADGLAVIDDLRPHERDMRPLLVNLRINGEKAYAPLGLGPTHKDKDFLRAWPDDVDAYKNRPGLLAYGHRFADVHESTLGATRVRDDRSSLRLTSPASWTTEDGIAIVARVEGHRRQLDTYLEASWQGHSGLYGFEQRFGLWLCRDFIPITQRNDILREALGRASRSRLRFELANLRNWKVFVNYQDFRLTANRNEISNRTSLETRITEALATVLADALKNRSFQDWVERLRNATLERWKKREVDQMRERLDDVEAWAQTTPKRDGIDPMAVRGLPLRDKDYSLPLKAPRSEQELFYVYGLLSGRYEMPIHIVEYDASEGVDAIGQLLVPALSSERRAHVRVEFKLEVLPGDPIHHFFDAIDVIICWKVGKRGPIYEESSSAIGQLQPRAKSVLSPPIDTHEIVYDADGKQRTIPVLEISRLFAAPQPSPRGRRG
jgi:hypothetical protein